MRYTGTPDPIMLIGALSDLWKKGILPEPCNPYFEWKLRGAPLFSLKVGYLVLIETSQHIYELETRKGSTRISEDENNLLMTFCYINEEVKSHLSKLK